MKWSSDNDFGTDIPIAVKPEDAARVLHLAHKSVPVKDLPAVLGALFGMTA